MELLELIFKEILLKTLSTPSVGAPIAYIGWIFLILPYGLLYLSDRTTHSKKVESRIKVKWNYPRILYIIGAFAILIDYVCIENSIVYKFPVLTDGMTVNLGVILMAAGLYLVTHGRISLNGYWGPHIYSYPDEHKQLVTTSIYKIMRHPIYSGQIIMAFATVFLLNNTVMLLFPLVLLPLNVRRGRREDSFLKTVFPREYEPYYQKTPFFGGLFG